MISRNTLNFIHNNQKIWCEKDYFLLVGYTGFFLCNIVNFVFQFGKDLLLHEEHIRLLQCNYFQ